jgi:myxalamid-type polyketide synthase MxaB
MAAEAGRDRQLAGRGMNLLPADKALEALEMVIQRGDLQTCVMAVDWTELLSSSSSGVPPLLRDVATDVPIGGDVSAEDSALRRSMLAQPRPARTAMLVDYFIAQLASITGLPAADIDPNQALNTMGLDSLMAIELKNKVEKRLQITIPMSAFLHEPSVSSLAGHAAEAFETSASGDSQSDAVSDTNGRPATPSDPSVAPPKYLSVKSTATPSSSSES